MLLGQFKQLEGHVVDGFYVNGMVSNQSQGERKFRFIAPFWLTGNFKVKCEHLGDKSLTIFARFKIEIMIDWARFGE